MGRGVGGYVPSEKTGWEWAGNPNPKNYKVMTVQEIGKFIVMKVNYPDAKNFEGDKILVFKDVKLVDLINARAIDPHFSSTDKLTPFARFKPTDEGWKTVIHFVNSYSNNW